MQGELGWGCKPGRFWSTRPAALIDQEMHEYGVRAALVHRY